MVPDRTDFCHFNRHDRHPVPKYPSLFLRPYRLGRCCSMHTWGFRFFLGLWLGYEFIRKTKFVKLDEVEFDFDKKYELNKLKVKKAGQYVLYCPAFTCFL